MKTTILCSLLLVLVGCAQTHRDEAVGYFLFNKSEGGNGWQSRYFDFIQISKTYAQNKKIAFDFDDKTPVMSIREKQGTLVAQVEFFGRFGEPYFAVDIDRRGKVLRHQLGITHE